MLFHSLSTTFIGKASFIFTVVVIMSLNGYYFLLWTKCKLLLYVKFMEIQFKSVMLNQYWIKTTYNIYMILLNLLKLWTFISTNASLHDDFIQNNAVSSVQSFIGNRTHYMFICCIMLKSDNCVFDFQFLERRFTVKVRELHIIYRNQI